MSAAPTGTALLPLHGGRVPAWLAARMARLGRVIVEAIAHEYGRTEVLRRLADPFWFQSMGAVMGMDWHSSGITTSVIGALKRGLAPVERELGLHVCGGRGRHARRTPDELLALSERAGLDGAALVRAGRASSGDAGAPRRPRRGHRPSPLGSDPGRGGGRRPARLRRAAAGTGRGRADAVRAGPGGRGGARRAEPVRRSGALLAGPRRQ